MDRPHLAEQDAELHGAEGVRLGGLVPVVHDSFPNSLLGEMVI